MPLGDLYNYLTIERATLSDSLYGDNDVSVWSTFTSCWAERINIDSSEGIRNEQVAVKDNITWKVRYNSSITEEMRIYFDGDYYNITGIVIEGRKKFMLLRSYKYATT